MVWDVDDEEAHVEDGLALRERNLALVETVQVNLVGGGDDVSRIDSSQGNTVDLEGAGNEEDTLVEGLQEDNALAPEAASEESEDGAGLEGFSRGPRTDGLAGL